MSLGTFISGAYTATYNSVAVGIMKDGFKVTFESKSNLVNKSDQFADMTIESIGRLGDWSLSSDSLEYKTGSIAPMLSWGNTLGGVYVPGILGSANGKSLVLTATTGTPAAISGGPMTLTAAIAILKENTNFDLMFDSTLREVPIRLRFLPSLVSSNVIHFAVT